MKAWCLILCILFSVYLCNAVAQQNELIFENYSQKDGLPSNESYFVYCDSKQYLWIATDRGVVRFNGSKFEKFELPDNVVFKIREDSKGRVWFFSKSGKLSYYFNGEVYPYKYNDWILDSIGNIIIIDAYVNENDEIVIASAYKNYKILSTGIVESTVNWNNAITDPVSFHISPIGNNKYFTRQLSFNDKDTVNITIDNTNETINYAIPCKLEIANQYGCITYGEKDFLFFYDNKLIRLLANGSFRVVQLPSRILCLNIGKNKKIWAGLLKNGVAVLNSELEHEQDIQSLRQISVSAISNDFEGGVWLTTLEKGVFYVKNTEVFIQHGDSNLSQRISRVYNVNDSILIFANTRGLFILSDKKVSTFYLRNNEEINDLFIRRNTVYLSGKVKFKSKKYYSLCKIEKLKTGFSDRIVIFRSSSELAIREKNKYYFLQGPTFAMVDLNETMPKGHNDFFVPTKINELAFKPNMFHGDKNGQIWIGFGKRLSRVHINPDSIVSLQTASEQFKNEITEIRQMPNGLFAVGMKFGGIAIMKTDSIVCCITEEDGLLSNTIEYLLPINDQLWVATGNGISVINFNSYDPIRYKLINIGKNEGFYNIIVNQLISFQGNILAATSNGIYVIKNPELFLNRVLPDLPFYISSISYYKGDTSGISVVTVPYKNNRVVIKYSAICFNASDEVIYQYKLNTESGNWQVLPGTELLLENLSPGTYNLSIRASIPGQRRVSTIQQLKITVEKPWWQNNLLRLTAVIFLAGIVFVLYRKRIRAIKEKERQKMNQHTRMMELEQTALRSQMNPHFIFNCLTSIQQQIVSGNSTDANEHLVKFARLIRKTLELSSQSYISIAEEKEYLSEYLYLEQLRLPGYFDYTIEIDGEMDLNETEIPNMMIQPLVENCIRHGIKEQEGRKGKISVSLSKKVDFILCKITDNGAGRKSTKENQYNIIEQHKSFGLDIVRKRLELLNEKNNFNYRIDIHDLKNNDGSAAGTQIVLQLPYKTGNT